MVVVDVQHARPVENPGADCATIVLAVAHLPDLLGGQPEFLSVLHLAVSTGAFPAPAPSFGIRVSIFFRVLMSLRAVSLDLVKPTPPETRDPQLSHPITLACTAVLVSPGINVGIFFTVLVPMGA